MANRKRSDSQTNTEGDRNSKKRSRRRFLKQIVSAGTAIAVGRLIPGSSGGVEAQTAPGPTFASPGQLASSGGTLKAVLEVNSDVLRSIPNVSSAAQLRYFQGWNPATPETKVPSLTAGQPNPVTPGPTFRAQLGDNVHIAFFNRVDDKKFSYSFVTAEGSGAHGCDQSSNPGIYPAADQFPNCFHGSSTANLHFHGTHTSPDGLADNVLVQVMPNRALDEKVLAKMFETVYANCPTKWSAMPAAYKLLQQTEVTKAGKGLWAFNEHQIHAGEWPQYISGAFPNCFTIPVVGAPNPYTKKPYVMGQAPGTHWYHAHKHGSTSLHILNGLAGAFIIEDNSATGYDTYLKNFYGQGSSYLPAFEKVLVIQNISTQQNLELQSAGRNGNGTQLVNGMLAPTITMLPGEVQLWRFVNASVGGNVSANVFKGSGFKFKQVAMDGVQLSQKNYTSQPFLNNLIPNGLRLAAGNRADVLVEAPTTPTSSPVPFPATGTPLFYVSVTTNSPADPSVGKGFPDNSAWPAIPPFLSNLGEPQGYPHFVTFGWDAEPQRNANGPGRLTTTQAGLLNVPPRFTIDNRQFEQFGPIIDQCIPLNALQDWVLENNTIVPHPFHIHINPFQVMQYDTPKVDASGGVTYTTYTPGSNTDPVWQDVITIPAGVNVNNVIAPGRVRIRHQFVDFTGTYVLHCHILAHEDRGMMQLVRVVDSNAYPNGCQVNIPQHH